MRVRQADSSKARVFRRPAGARFVHASRGRKADAAPAGQLEGRATQIDSGDEAEDIDLDSLDPADRHAEQALQRQLQPEAARAEAGEDTVRAEILAEGGR